MKRYDKAVETLQIALNHIKEINSENKDGKDKTTQVPTLEMYAYYNLGVQYEYLK